MKTNRKETYAEKIQHLMKLSGEDSKSCAEFIEFVSKYLDGCGYFMSDFNIHNLPTPKDFIKYSERDFGTWLMDMALQYNMEQGVEYKCELVKDWKIK